MANQSHTEKSKTVHVGDPGYTYELILDQISQCQNMLNIQHGQFLDMFLPFLGAL